MTQYTEHDNKQVSYCVYDSNPGLAKVIIYCMQEVDIMPDFEIDIFSFKGYTPNSCRSRLMDLFMLNDD